MIKAGHNQVQGIVITLKFDNGQEVRCSFVDGEVILESSSRLPYYRTGLADMFVSMLELIADMKP